MFKKLIKKIVQQKGAVSVILALLVLSVLLVIALGVSAVSLNQLRIFAQMGQSVSAYYAAEAGVEKCLYDVWQQGQATCSYSETLDNGANYQVSGDLAERQIESLGGYLVTNRKIKVDW